MRRLILPISIALALATGAALAETRLALEPPPRPAPEPDRSANRRLVAAWYESVNLAIRTGDVAGLAGSLAPDFVDHTIGPAGAGQAGLETYLRELHTTHPTLRLDLLDLIAEGDRVVVHLRVEGAEDGRFLGMPVPETRVWSRVDVVRIAAGQIAERWGDGTLVDRFTPLLEVTVPLRAPGARTIALERHTYAPGERTELTDPDRIALLLGEMGTLQIHLADGTARFIPRAPTGTTGAPTTVEPGSKMAFGSGDGILLEDGAVGEVSNEGTSPATLLIVTMARLPTAAHSTRTWSGNRAEPTPPREPAEASNGMLAGGQRLDVSGEEVVLAIGRATTTAGVAGHTVAGAELVSVEAGAMMLVAGNGAAWVRRGHEAGISSRTSALLAAGDGALTSRCSTARYQSATGAPLDLLIVTVTPALPAVAQTGASSPDPCGAAPAA